MPIFFLSFSFYFFDSVCVVCMLVWFEYMCECMFTSMWSPKADVRNHHQLLFYLIEAESLNQSIDMATLTFQVFLSLPPNIGITGEPPRPLGINIGFENLNSASHACHCLCTHLHFLGPFLSYRNNGAP